MSSRSVLKRTESKTLGGQKMDILNYPKTDHIYVNCSVYNDTTDSVDMVFDQQSTTPILDNPEKYHLAIVRFSVPGTDVPIMNWPGDEFYSVTLTYDNNDYQAYVELVPPSNSGSETVWYYQQMIQMINTAFESAFDDMITANPGIASVAPYLTYEPSTQLIALNCETLYATTPIDVFCNFNLNQLLQSIDEFSSFATGPNLKEVQFYIRDQKNNHITIEDTVVLSSGTTNTSTAVTSVALFTQDLVGALVSGTGIIYGTYVTSFIDASNITISAAATATATNNLTYVKQLPGYKMEQEYSTLFTWNSLQSIVFITESLPVRNEFITPMAVSDGSVLANTSKAILNDFEPINDPLSAGSFRNYFQYQPQVYRYTDMVGNNPLYKISFKIYWSDNEGILYPMSLNPNESFDVKLLFEERKDYKPIKQ